MLDSIFQLFNGSWKMKNTASLFVILSTILLFIYGCGGGSNSSDSSPYISSSTSESSTSPNYPSSSPESFTNSFTVNPLRDLGLGKGENVCFRIKSYNNIAISDFSKAICGQIKNDHKLTLSWNKVHGKIDGYYVYYGANKNKATNFLTDVIEG